MNKRPFTEDFLGDKQGETLKYFFVSSNLNIEQEYCDGLATADIMDIPSISLNHHNIWKSKQIEIFKEKEGGNPESVFVCNVATEEKLLCEYFKTFSKSRSTITLLPSTLSFEEKKQRVHLGDHHGKKILKEFSEKIIKNDYVEGVLSSIDFNSETSRFLRRIYKDGTIKITLHWTDSGHSMILKTTGRNYRETEAIANKLKEEFDK